MTVTPEILKDKFIEITKYNADEFCNDYPELTAPQEIWEYNEFGRVFMEREFHRNLFMVILDSYSGFDVYVMEDVGCGFTRIPLRWSELTVDTLNHLYQAFMEKDIVVLT